MSSPRPSRVFLVRHGETEWSKLGRLTSFTELELTETGVQQIFCMTSAFVGAGKLIDPDRIAHIFVSPRVRAQHTLELLLSSQQNIDKGKISTTDLLAEWNYGSLEGKTTEEIRERKGQIRLQGSDLTRDWDVREDGCKSAGGESPEEITERVDKFISDVKDFHKPYMQGEGSADILLVGHGLLLRCLMKRWVGLPIREDFRTELEPGAIGTLGYKNNNVDEPAIHFGTPLPFPGPYHFDISGIRNS